MQGMQQKHLQTINSLLPNIFIDNKTLKEKIGRPLAVRICKFWNMSFLMPTYC